VFGYVHRALSTPEATQGLRDRFPPPRVPWTLEYLDRHTRFLTTMLDTPEAVDLFRSGDQLPDGYGIGLDERVVEYPWVFAQAPFGRLLDAGSVLNHEHVLNRFQPQSDDLHIATLAPEDRSFTERGISYVYSDLRDLPYRDGRFDTIACISTLEHVGMDNRGYGAAGGREGDPRRQVWAALAELRRVLRPGGTALITVPYGRREDHVWLRQLDKPEVQEMVAAFEPRESEVRVYAYTPDGWRLSDLDAAAAATYRDYTRDPTPVADLAAAARAVACLRLVA
jgi:SAM-dependent methyltransferase